MEEAAYVIMQILSQLLPIVAPRYISTFPTIKPSNTSSIEVNVPVYL